MPVYFLNRVHILTSSTGEGTVNCGNAIDDSMFTPAEAGAVSGRVYPWVIEEGLNVEIVLGAWTSGSPATIARTTVLKSKIGGSAGTAKIDLQGGGTVRCATPAEYYAALGLSPIVADEAQSLSDAQKLQARKNIDGASETDQKLQWLYIADQWADRLSFPNGIVDPFDDEGDIDTANSSDESYDSVNDRYTGGVGGNDANTVALLHFNGSDGSTTITDSNVGGSAHTWSVNGNAQIDTAQSVFGGASGLVDGSGDWFSTPNHADFQFGSGDFAIDLRVRFASITDAILVGLSHFTSTNRTWILYYDTATSQLQFIYYADGVTGTTKGVSWSPSTGTWYDVRVTRNGNNLRFFVNGTQVGSTQDVTGLTMFTGWNAAPNLTIGAAATTGILPANGWFDEVRISKGVARHTSNFTPPAGEYSSGAMDLRSNAFTAASAPSTARLVFQVYEGESVTVNTDFKGYVSRDGGTTWTQATLALVMTLANGDKLYEASGIDISGQPSGTSMKWRFTTHNGKNVGPSGVVMNWS
jgi:hypothetical protein